MERREFSRGWYGICRQAFCVVSAVTSEGRFVHMGVRWDGTPPSSVTPHFYLSSFVIVVWLADPFSGLPRALQRFVGLGIAVRLRVHASGTQSQDFLLPFDVNKKAGYLGLFQHPFQRDFRQAALLFRIRSFSISRKRIGAGLLFPTYLTVRKDAISGPPTQKKVRERADTTACNRLHH